MPALIPQIYSNESNLQKNKYKLLNKVKLKHQLKEQFT